MWGESSKNCEVNCQCSGLITENFKINSGNSATKRKQETALSNNYKLKMNPHSLDFDSPISPHSPITAKRRILGELQNFKPSSPVFERLMSSPDLKSQTYSLPLASYNCMKSPHSLKSPLSMHSQSNFKSPSNIQSPLNVKSPSNLKSPLNFKSPSNIQSPLNLKSPNIKSPLNTKSPLSICPLSINSPITTHSPLTSKLKRSSKISKIFEERSRFKMSNKENLSLENETFIKLDVEEETRDCSFEDKFLGREPWSMSKLDFSDALPSKSYEADVLVPEKDQDLDDVASLKDLEVEFENENFDQCTKYEIISTDSPNIISRGRSSTSRKITSRNFDFGAPLAESEPSTSFNRPATRILTFDDDDFDFPSPAIKKTISVKKSLKFHETPTSLLRQQSDSSIGSMSTSPSSSLNRVFTSESTTSMESGFISELEEPFLEIEESNSPKIANFNDLLSGEIKQNAITDKGFLRRPNLARSLSFNPETKAKVSLLSILESPDKKSQKREREEESRNSKRRRSNCESPVESLRRPVLQRAYSESNASIMSALARSVKEPDLIGDFSQPFSLPLTGGVHSDLKSISSDTLADLLRGRYDSVVTRYQVIDCRYPYEYSGGHITGAVNLYTPSHIQTLVHTVPEHSTVLIFHCEFSLERGPNLSRFLRSSDREKNKENYPSLHYPEVYLLHEGYRAFYQKHPDLCTPEGYTAMLDPKHRHLLRKHRSAGPTNNVRRNRLLL